MDFPPVTNWFSVILLVICFVGVPAISFIGWILSGNMDNKRQEKKEAQNNALRKRGVTAPATVVSARTIMSRSPAGRKEIRIDYEVDVQPEGRTPFRQSFQHWEERRGYTAIAGQLVGEQGRRIWVSYDPNDPSQMIFEHDDKEHEAILKERELESRRLDFNKLAELNNEIRKSGEEAEAIITRVEDLNLEYPLKGSRAMHLWFDVMPRSGPTFQSETDALIANTALGKYSAGKKVHVKFDPRNPGRAALDGEKNKSIQ